MNTPEGGRKAAATFKMRYGTNARIANGRKGGQAPRSRCSSCRKVTAKKKLYEVPPAKKVCESCLLELAALSLGARHYI